MGPEDKTGVCVKLERAGRSQGRDPAAGGFGLTPHLGFLALHRGR